MKRIAMLLVPAALLAAAACSQTPTSAAPGTAPSARHDGTTSTTPNPADSTGTGRGIMFGGGF